MLSLDQPVNLRLPQLLVRFSEGAMTAPRFHRGLVWTPEQRLALLDSVWRGIPMGNVFVWRTSQDIPTEDPFVLVDPPLTGRRPPALNEYLLDGLQRVFTLWSSLGPALVGKAETPGDFPSALNPSEWPAFFDLNAQEFRLGPDHGVPETWMPTALVLDAFALIRFQRRLSESMGAGENVRILINRSELLAERFKYYAIPVIYIVTDDVGQAATCYERANAGRPLDER